MDKNLKRLTILALIIQSIYLIRELSTKTVEIGFFKALSLPEYIIFLLASAILIVTIILLIGNRRLWWVGGLFSVITYQIILIRYVSSITLLAFNITLFILVLIGFFFWQFHYQYKKLVQSILDYEIDDKKVVIRDDLLSLPKPVRKWLEKSNVVGSEFIQKAYLEQDGQLRLQPDQKWLDSSAKQFFNAIEPSFIWVVETKMNNIPILGRDLFFKGKGSMLIKIASLFAVVNEKSSKKLNEATMQRFLGEIVWFPTAALSKYIKWKEIDDFSAKAIMSYKNVEGEATFFFDKNYNLDKFLAYRFRDVKDDKRTLWEAKVIKTKKINGILIPVELEASWIPEKDDKFTWYKFKIKNVKYNEKVPTI